MDTLLNFLVQIRDLIAEPWPWWVAGPAIAAVMFLLLYFGHEFGISENFRIMCAADGADEMNEFFNINWKDSQWNLLVALGAVFAGYMASHYFLGPDGDVAHISDATVASLKQIGVNVEPGKVPIVPDFVSWTGLFSARGFVTVVLGGFLVGFGSRYAGGCTSGHAISGLSALQLPSLIAVIGFFIGGLFVTYVILPVLLS
jgi:uncharacterized membrane protein YedE/YeeE